MNIQYMGLSDSQVFSEEDFAKAGLNQETTEFPRATSVEVSDEVGEMLLSTDMEESPIFFDTPFEVSPPEVENPDELKGKALDEAVRLANEAGANIKTSGTVDEKRAALKEYLPSSDPNEVDPSGVS